MSLQTRLVSLVQAIGADIKQLRTDVNLLNSKAEFDAGVVGGPAPTDTVDAGAATGSQPLGLIDGGTDVMINVTSSVDGGASPTEAYSGIVLP